MLVISLMAGGYPKTEKTENGPLPESYSEFQVLSRGGYPKRTEQNVIDSDGTVIFTYGKLSGGSSLTKRIAVKHNRPCLHVDLDTANNPVHLIQDWLIDWDVKVLNVAGKSASKAPTIYNHVKDIIQKVLEV